MAEQHEHSDDRVARSARPDAASVSKGADPAANTNHEAAEFTAVQVDDALLDALGGPDAELTGSLADHELNELLLAWRRDVDGEPIPELVDTDTAVTTIAAGRQPVRTRHRFLVPLATAAAVLAIAFTGVGLAARDAQPGDPLWGLTRVLYSDHARSVEAAASVRNELDRAGLAISAGRIADARSALAKAQVSLPTVSREDGRADLAARREELVQRLSANPPATGTTTPSYPNSNPAVPAPGGPVASSSSPPSTTPSTTPNPSTSPAPSTSTAPPTSSTGTQSGGTGSRSDKPGDSTPLIPPGG
ncbi:anti-sigma-D factor RsdA [Gandjariella thermophila]|uniref:Anti-sigma-D factor RsdA sigma factor binding region domain-containing protein n=1 Tax=Gandjariella thermophila TaxID=1931992 RepID=A0A4D4IYG3_9PSEU|nr:anti-sigma-D factor RsdA [Gandjariella thermophila]GDY29281.1 hypothetical protein GTS_09140 [Gandjariella thermophila]